MAATRDDKTTLAMGLIGSTVIAALFGLVMDYNLGVWFWVAAVAYDFGRFRGRREER